MLTLLAIELVLKSQNLFPQESFTIFFWIKKFLDCNITHLQPEGSLYFKGLFAFSTYRNKKFCSGSKLINSRLCFKANDWMVKIVNFSWRVGLPLQWKTCSIYILNTYLVDWGNLVLLLVFAHLKIQMFLVNISSNQTLKLLMFVNVRQILLFVHKIWKLTKLKLAILY